MAALSSPDLAVVQCHGVFDILHYGHLMHLMQARALGDRLVVTITADEYIHKGPGRPVFPAEKRKAMLEELRCVDEVHVIHASGAEEAVMAVQPNIYCKGQEYRGRLPEQTLVESLGGKVVFTIGETHSSTELVPFV